MLEDLQPIIDWLNANPDWIIFSLGFVAFLESLALVGIVIPGVAILFVIAALAGNTAIAIESALLAAFIGAVLGDVLSFYIGYIFKDSLPQRWPFKRFPDTLSMGRTFFYKHGGKSVIIGRFVGPIRPILPIIAGMMGMSQLRFISFNLFSALAWAPFYVLPGYWSGAAIQQDFPDNAVTFAISAVLILALIAMLFRYLSQRIQPGHRWYDALEIEIQSSPLLQRVWHFLTRHQSSPKEFPLASLFLLVLMSALFWAWTLILLKTPWLSQLDQSILSLCQSIRGTMADQIFVFLTLLGNEAFLYCSFILLILLFVIKKQVIAAVHLAGGGLITAAVTHGFKAWFSIPRPELVMTPPSSFAYPSGHSSGAVILWGLLASFIAQDMAHNQRWRAYLVCFTPMLLIAFSRVFLGVHWFSDIIGGLALGLSICALTRISYSRYQAKPLNLIKENKWELVLFFLLWAGAAMIYQSFHYENTLAEFQVTLRK